MSHSTRKIFGTVLEENPAHTADLKPIPLKPKLEKLRATLIELKKQFDALIKISNDKTHWDALSEEERIENEKQKLKIMQEVHALILFQYGVDENNVLRAHAVNKPAAKWRETVFGVLSFINLVMAPITGFFGAVSLLQIIIPGFTYFAACITAAIVVAIESTMSFSTFKPYLQRALEIPPKLKPEALAESYGIRLDMMENLNGLMINNLEYTRKKGPETYRCYASILKSFNADLEKKDLLKTYQESKTKKAARYFLLGLNTVFSIASTYFAATLLLSLVGAALLGTPAGWGVIGIIVVSQLVMKFLMHKSSIFDLLNPAANSTNVVKERLDMFKDKSKKIDQDLVLMQTLADARKKEIDSLRKPGQEPPKALHWQIVSQQPPIVDRKESMFKRCNSL